MKLDPILFGEYVLIKPTNAKFASYGRGIQLFRRRKLEAMTTTSFPRDHPIHRDRDAYIVQRFIDTGPFLAVYRVLTLFGVPLSCFFAQERLPQTALGGSDEEIEGRRVTSNTGTFRVRSLCNDADVLSLAARVGKAFPDILFSVPTLSGKRKPESCMFWNAIPAEIPGISHRSSRAASGS